MLIPVLVAVALVTSGASFAAFSAALVSVDRGELERRSAAGSRWAAATLRTLEQPAPELNEVRLGAVLSTVALGAVIEPLVDALIASSTPGMSDPSRGLTVGTSLALAIGVQVVVGEMLARSVGAQRPVGTLMAVRPLAAVVTVVLGPLAAAGDAVARAVIGRLSPDPSAAVARLRSRDELRRLVHLSERSGAIRTADAELFDRTLRFGEKTAADAFTPRVEVESLPVDATIGDLVDRCATTGFSRFPVHDEGLDDIVGVVHVKDVLGVAPGRRRAQPVAHLMRPVHAVPESKDLETLMVELRDAAGQFAVVVDEYGGTAGIVTLEDLIEEIVGDISDEHDPAAVAPAVRRWAGAHLLAGSLHLDEVHDACGFEMPEGEYETIAGFVMAELGRVPSTGDHFAHDGWDLEVTEMEGNRVRTVKVVAPSPGAQQVIGPLPEGSE